MVAFLPLLSIGLTSLTLAAFLLYPRLPHYSFQIKSVSPRWFSGEGFRAHLGAQVRLKNDNFVAIDIHALSFDLYYPDWWGETQLLANVQDTRLREIIHTSQKDASSEVKAGEVETQTTAASASEQSPIWQLQPRQLFETYDHVLMEPIGGLATITNLMYAMMQNWGVVQVLSTGAIHLVANGNIPLTLNILCDNVLDGFTIFGMHCELKRMDVGWQDIPTAMEFMADALLHSQKVKESSRQNVEDESMVISVGTKP